MGIKLDNDGVEDKVFRVLVSLLSRSSQQRIHMNKAKVIEQMSKLTKLPKSTVKECLEAFISTIGGALKQKKNVALTGFGTFSVMMRKSRSGINPVTKKPMIIPAKNVPKFKAGKALKDSIR